MARYELVPDRDGFLLIRDGERIISLGGSKELAEGELHPYREQERQARG